MSLYLFPSRVRGRGEPRRRVRDDRGVHHGIGRLEAPAEAVEGPGHARRGRAEVVDLENRIYASLLASVTVSMRHF